MSHVVVISPFRESATRTRAEHGAMAQLLCRKLARAGHAVYAGHLLCTTFLDEDLKSDREAGIAINLGWIERCDRLAIWDVWGISSGMKDEIDHAEKCNLKRIQEDGFRLSISIDYFSRGEVPEWEGPHSLR